MAKRVTEKLVTTPKDDSVKSAISFETFMKFGVYEQMNLTREKPNCFNGIVSIQKYKITVEPIIDTNEVLAERLQKLWDETTNYHHWTPIENEAKKIGYTLKGSAGNNIPK